MTILHFQYLFFWNIPIITNVNFWSHRARNPMTLEFVQIFNFLNNNDDLWGMENIPEFLYHQMLPEFLLLDLLLTPVHWDKLNWNTSASPHLKDYP